MFHIAYFKKVFFFNSVLKVASNESFIARRSAEAHGVCNCFAVMPSVYQLEKIICCFVRVLRATCQTDQELDQENDSCQTADAEPQ